MGTAAGTSTTPGTVVDDSIITTKVKTALLTDPTVRGSDISVETRKGEVLLSGFVNNQSQIDEAQKVTRGIEGVKIVSNKMTLKR